MPELPQSSFAYSKSARCLPSTVVVLGWFSFAALAFVGDVSLGDDDGLAALENANSGEIPDWQRAAERNPKAEGNWGPEMRMKDEHGGFAFFTQANSRYRRLCEAVNGGSRGGMVKSEQSEVALKRKIFRGRSITEEILRENQRDFDASVNETDEEELSEEINEDVSAEDLDDGASALEEGESDEDEKLGDGEWENMADGDGFEELEKESKEMQREEKESESRNGSSKETRNSAQIAEEVSNEWTTGDMLKNKWEGGDSQIEEVDAENIKSTYPSKKKKLERLGHIKTLPRRPLDSEKKATFAKLTSEVSYQNRARKRMWGGTGFESKGPFKRNFFWEHVLGISKASTATGNTLQPKILKRNSALGVKEAYTERQSQVVGDIQAFIRTGKGVSLFATLNLHEGGFTSDDEPVDLTITDQLESLADIEDAIFASASDKSFKKLVESLKDTSRKESTYPSTVVNNPWLQDPDSIDPLFGLTKSDRAFRKALSKAGSEAKQVLVE